MARAIVEKPVAIIAHTIPGKGVTLYGVQLFMARQSSGYYRATGFDRQKADQAKLALKQLRTLDGKIRSEAHD